jgi:glycerol-3-phosphate dehydrogenase (NAD(P)+)
MSSIDISIIGAGSWGKALSHVLLNNNKKILIYSRNPNLECYENNSNVILTNDIKNIFTNKAPTVIATPVKSLNEIGSSMKKNNFKNPVILTCKGIDSLSGQFPTQIISQYIDHDNLAVLSGPSFSSEVLENKPTAITIASTNNNIFKIFSELFHSKIFRVYASDDIIGCQLGGAIKNILAVAVGISDGLDLGSNAKAALISRGIFEIKTLSDILGCRNETIYGLSGLGDLVLTANDNLSRNRRFGIEVANGLSIEDAEKKIGHVVEGIFASKGLNILIKKYSLNLPICSKVIDIINNKINPEEAVNDLLIREQKKEFV